MRLLIQRVLEGSVSVGDQLISQIGPGLVVLLGVHEKDDDKIAKKLAHKLPKLRLWEKDGKAWNGSVQDLDYELLIVSQFTLYAVTKGNKPDFHLSKKAEDARILYEYFVEEVKKAYKPEKVKIGAFQQLMRVNIVNNGPVTIELDELPGEKPEKQEKQDKQDKQEKQDKQVKIQQQQVQNEKM